MTVYSFDKEFAVETKKTVNIGGQVQTLNFNDDFIKKIDNLQISIEGISDRINKMDLENKPTEKQKQIFENTVNNLRDTAIDGLNKLLNGRGQELYNHYGQNTNALVSIIQFLNNLAVSVVKDQKASNKSK